MQRTPLKRAVAGLTALALAGVGVLALAPPASAADAVATLEPATRPTVLAGNARDAGDWTVNVTNAAVATNTIRIRVGPDACTAASEAVGFNDIPAVDVLGTATENVTGSLTTDCGAATGIGNVLTLTIGAGGLAADTDIKLSSIELDVGAEVPLGNVRVEVNDVAQPSTAVNAIVAKVDRPAAGALRDGTAALLARDAYPQPNCVADRKVIVVSGADANFPDALTASPLAGKRDVPILLVNPTLPIPTETANALRDLGVKNVTIIGGTSAVTTAVENAIEARPVTDCGGADAAGTDTIAVDRIAGGTRWETSRAVAAAVGAGGTFDEGLVGACQPIKTAFLVSGENYADALAAGPLAARGSAGGCGSGQLPIILTAKAALSEEAVATMNDLDVDQVIIVGGAAAVATAVQTSAGAGGVNVERVAGGTRQETAALVADIALKPTLGNFDGGRAYIATGTGFADALTAGPIAGKREAPLLLTATGGSLGTFASNVLKNNRSILHASLLGGTAALANTVATEAGTAFTSRSAAIV